MNTITTTPAPRTITIDELAQLPMATNVQVGDIVVANVRSRYRIAIVRKIGRVNATVECHTPSGYAEAVERGRADRNIASLHAIADQEDAKAARYDQQADVIEAAIADGSLNTDIVCYGKSDDYRLSVSIDSLPTTIQHYEERSSYDRTTYVYAPAKYREWAENCRRHADIYRTTRVAEAEAWNARPVADRIAACVAGVTSTKTVKLTELRRAA